MAILHGECDIHPNSIICDSAIIGKPFRPLLEGNLPTNPSTIIKENVYVGDYCVVGKGSVLGENSKIDDYCKVECNVTIGKNTILMNRALLQNYITVGEDCVIAAIIGERAIIGNRCRVFGGFAHSHYDPSIPWDADESSENPPILEDDVLVGFNSTLIGGIKIGKKSYVCAGAVLSRDLPSYHIAYSYNKICHYKEWKGILKESNFFSLDNHNCLLKA